MSNDLTTQKYLTNEDYFAAVAGEAETLKGGGSGKAFMKFSGDTGDYNYGSDDTELAIGTQLVLNPRSYKRGWVIWVDSKVVYEIMHSLEQGAPPVEAALPANWGAYAKGEGPVEQQTIEFATTDEPFVEMIFQANNVSKRRALAALLKEFGVSYKLHPDPDQPKSFKYPVVEIEAREFETKGEGRKVKKWAPAFKIIAWISEAEMIAMKGEGTPEDYQPEADETPAVENKPAARPAAVATKAAEPAKKRGRF